MTEASSERPPASANFINPETVHPPFGYSHVVEVTAGRLVYIAGQVALDPAGTLVGADDIRAQTRQVFDNLRAALQAVGAGFEQVVKLNLYLVDATQLPVVREVRDQYVNTRQPPASTAVEVRRLFREDALIEVEAMAVIGSAQPTGEVIDQRSGVQLRLPNSIALMVAWAAGDPLGLCWCRVARRPPAAPAPSLVTSLGTRSTGAPT